MYCCAYLTMRDFESNFGDFLKVVRLRVMKGHGGEGDITPLILNLGTAWCELPAATTSLPARK
jgi:hypothetical protein